VKLRAADAIGDTHPDLLASRYTGPTQGAVFDDRGDGPWDKFSGMAKKRDPNLIGLLISGIVSAVAPLVGVAVTLFSLQGAFSQSSSADPSEKARVLAEGISNSMNATAWGMVVSILALVSSVIFAVRLLHNVNRKS
jgi:ABC-type Fe3+ transport system permease subunit